MLNVKDCDNLGKKVKIINSSDNKKINMEGLVIYETSELLTLRIDNDIKKIKKKEILDYKIIE
ncbi:MAG: ribonuclease P protein subunit [Candidatus ainarchaeum sp.]|nr:ribonuclease P protein subunit [Candidatus ainarchaeum sp.]